MAVRVHKTWEDVPTVGESGRSRHRLQRDSVADEPDIAYLIVGQNYTAHMPGHATVLHQGVTKI
jgi:hypothetical protein